MRILKTILKHCCLKNTPEDEGTLSPAPPPSDQMEKLKALEACPAFEFTFAKISSSSSFNLTPAQAQEIGVARELQPIIVTAEPVIVLEDEGKTKYYRKKKEKRKKHKKESKQELKGKSDNSQED